MRKVIAGFALASTALLGASAVMAGPVLDRVRQNDMVVCGVNTAAPGFSNADSKGQWSGLDVDYCHALAAAVLGDANKVKYVPLNSPQRFSALQAGEVDILARNTTWNLTRDASLGAVFIGINYFDGQGFMVPKKYNITSAKQLNGATICVQSGTSSEKSVADYFNANKMKYKAVLFDTTEATQSAFISGRCQVYTTDMSDLAGARTRAKNPDDFVILSEVISKEPLGPSVAKGDNEWFQIARWVLNAWIEAEELGVTNANVDTMRDTSANPNVQRLLGKAEDMGKLLGLDKDWSYRIVKQVGNYGESFDKNLGPNSALKLPRGINNLWTSGGILYAPPVR